MSERISYSISGYIVTITYGGNSYPITPDHVHYAEIRKAIKDKKLDLLPKLLDVKAAITAKSRGRFSVVAGRVLIDGEQVSDLVSLKILEFMTAKHPYEPLVKFWRNLKLNPDPVAREALYGFLSKFGHPLTEDGCFIAYKNVCENYDSHADHKVNYKIGSVVKMDRAACDSDPRNTCSRGLHVANRNYAWGFHSGGHMIECKVNPRDVVAIPPDYNNEKMRVCELQVVRDNDKGLLRTSYINISAALKKDAKIAKEGVKPPAKRRTFYRLVKGQILTVRRSTCPEGYSETKPVVKPKTKAKPKILKTKKIVSTKRIKSKTKQRLTYYKISSRGKILAQKRATSCPAGWTWNRPR